MSVHQLFPPTLEVPDVLTRNDAGGGESAPGVRDWVDVGTPFTGTPIPVPDPTPFTSPSPAATSPVASMRGGGGAFSEGDS